ncbi:MAG: UvrD-helicase domain-containing protein [Deltaproteobacteria bacterium]|nr:UvrD-helicase domain-containing protein [Deltaproteobacteria bacterium]
MTSDRAVAINRYMAETISLNPKQKTAVDHNDGPLLVLAGAGSGKTRVLVERMIRLIRDRVALPWNILAVTFTNKAAKEMKDRIAASLGESSQRLWVSTFHSFCLRLLRRHATELGYQNPFAIYDDTDQKTVVKKILKEKDLDEKIYKIKSVCFHIDKAKNEAVDPEQFNDGGDYYLKKIKELYTDYQKELIKNNAMDFGDLIVNTLRLFTRFPDILGEYQEQFKFIMIDEYQDTNLSQYLLVRLLADKYKNLFVVGDDDQSIYKFRGAEIKNILGFQKDFSEAKVVRLEQNYRSTQNILNAANAVIKVNAGRMGKNLWTENCEGEKIQIYGGETEKEEAGFLTRVIKEYAAEGAAYSDLAVFYRTNAQSRSIEDELRNNQVPYRIYGGIRFYDRAEIKDIVAYLNALVNPRDGISIKRIINVPARGIGKTTMQKIEAVATRTGKSLWAVMSAVKDVGWGLDLSAGTEDKILGFCSLLDELKQAKADVPLEDFLTTLYDKSSYWQMLTDDKSIEALGRKENLTELVNVLDEYIAATEDPSLESFLDQLSLATSADEGKDNNNSVTLMTIHLAKGLEFPIVFLVGMEEGLFPHARSFENEDDLEEERRLCYVGMTRAKQRLHMTYANERRIFGQSQYNFPSRFLKEIPSGLTGHAAKDRSERVRDMIAVTQVQNTHVEFKPQAFNQGFAAKTETSAYKREVDLSYSQTDTPIKKGAWVRHTVFGDGQVLGFEGERERLKVMIRFNSGMQKKLLFHHANLTILR